MNMEVCKSNSRSYMTNMRYPIQAAFYIKLLIKDLKSGKQSNWRLFEDKR